MRKCLDLLYLGCALLAGAFLIAICAIMMYLSVGREFGLTLRGGDEITADVVLLCDGVNSLLVPQAVGGDRLQPDQVAVGIALGEALLASMPAYAEIYPTGIVRKVWPTELVEGESDAMVVER